MLSDKIPVIKKKTLLVIQNFSQDAFFQKKCLDFIFCGAHKHIIDVCPWESAGFLENFINFNYGVARQRFGS